MSDAAQRAQLVAAFEQVRAIPYATDAGFDAASTQRLGAGNCGGKAELLRDRVGEFGIAARIVRWRYELTDPFAHLLPIAFDVHTAMQINIDGEWVLVDATHDPGLPSPPFVVTDWDGEIATVPAYPPQSDMWISGEHDQLVDCVIRDITHSLDGVDTSAYRTAFNAWLRELRAGGANN